MKGLGLKPSKAIGQNFLKDKKIAEWIVEQAGIRPGDRVLEIGPGLGILTGHILRKTKSYVGVELDARLAGHIEKKHGVEIINADVLGTDLPEFDKIVSNLPYQISSEIINKLLVECEFQRGILMFQKEFALHLVASPGNRAYSRISVLASYYADCEIIRHVPKDAFYPAPKVDSAIVKLTPRPATFRPSDEKYYFDLVRVLFSHKNRKIRNALVSEHRRLGVGKEDIKGWVDEVPHANDRAVTLAPEKLNEIAEWLNAKMQ